MSNQQEAIDYLARNGRSIITYEKAKELMKDFELSVNGLHARCFDAEPGIDWGARTEIWEGGKAIGIASLAGMIADRLGAPPLEPECCPYMGAGKSEEWHTSRSVKRIVNHLSA